MQIVLPQLVDSREWRQLVDAVAKQDVLAPFSDLLIDFINDVSLKLLRGSDSRRYPDALALGYWLRKTHILEIKKKYEEKRSQAIRGPRGLVLHFAPSNVDTIFIYSWFLAMLLGNSNIVRISKQRGEQAEWLLRQVGEVLGEEKYQEIQKRVLIVSYGHEEEITHQLSSCCQMRVIWGGDETVRRIRAIPLPAGALELAFADKFSLAAFDAERVFSEDEESFAKFVQAFYNDAFWFNQKACSSARAIIWIGAEKTVTAARERFWPAVKKLLQQKNYTIPTAAAMNQLVTAYDFALTGSAQKIKADFEPPSLVSARQLTPQHRTWHCGGGLFIELVREDLADITDVLSRKDQTLGLYGFSNELITALAPKWSAKGLCRVVPVGQALQFDVVWDGYDLLEMFTREVYVGDF